VTDPVQAMRLKPGEYRLPVATIAKGDRFTVLGAVYEITSDPTRWGAAWVANVKVIEGLRPGSEFRGMLHTSDQS